MIRVKATREHVYLVCILAILAAACSAKDSLPAVRDGDLIFQTSRSSQSLAIQRATGSPYSHMGLVLTRDGKPYVFEAIATVRFTPLERWIARGTGHHFVIKRLRNADRVLDSAGVAKLRAAALRFEGRQYDLSFEWSDERMYCSELVWKAYDRGLGIQVGALQEIREFNLSDPAVRAKLHERYGDNIPLREPVISPVSMFRSALLVTVAEQ
jgi:Permuted papain-like amidase enzyme, YaeF/YiiX, C92 family